MPITLGILAQSRQAPVAAGSYDLIESVLLSSTASSVTFTGLATYASTYKHLQIRFTARQPGGTGFNGNGIIRFNGDSATNYNYHALYTTDGPVSSGGAANSNAVNWWLANENGVSGAFGAGVVDILDAFNTSKFKTVRMLDGAFQTSSFYQRHIALRSGAWRNTASLTTIEIGVSADVMAIGSRFSLYGVK